MRLKRRSPYRVFLSIFAFVSCICACISLALALSGGQVGSGHVAILMVIAIATALLGYVLIRRPKF